MVVLVEADLPRMLRYGADWLETHEKTKDFFYEFPGNFPSEFDHTGLFAKLVSGIQKPNAACAIGACLLAIEPNADVFKSQCNLDIVSTRIESMYMRRFMGSLYRFSDENSKDTVIKRLRIWADMIEEDNTRGNAETTEDSHQTEEGT
jgi:hypothetical protein